MATRKRNKEAEAWKLEVDEIDRQVRERREEIKELLNNRYSNKYFHEWYDIIEPIVSHEEFQKRRL